MNETRSAPRAERAAEWLARAHAARERFSPLPDELTPRTIEEAYAVQGELVELRAKTWGRRAGYKIALTTPTMREMCGMSDSVVGEVLEKSLRTSPARVRGADFARLLIEFEIAFELAEDLPPGGAPYAPERVAAAVAAVMPAFELVDDRRADYARLPETPLMLIADNAWNAGAVLGERVRDWRNVDLAALRGTATINDEPVGEGHGRDVMGHPLEAMAWIANHLAARGRGLSRDEVVLTGSLISSKFPGPGDVVRFAAGALGEVSLGVD